MMLIPLPLALDSDNLATCAVGRSLWLAGQQYDGAATGRDEFGPHWALAGRSDQPHVDMPLAAGRSDRGWTMTEVG